jgi:hypothetical protein
VDAENKPNGAEPTPVAANGWAALDRFAADLPLCQDRAAATHRFLTAVHEGLRADTVFVGTLDPAAPAPTSVEVVGVPASAAWCQALLRCALSAAPWAGHRLLVPVWSVPVDCARSAGDPSGPPCRVAMVRLSRSRSAWAVALSFRPARRWGPDDMSLLVLARQLLVDNWQQRRQQVQLRNTVLGLVRAFTATMDGRDRFTVGHSEEVARIAVRLGERMGLTPADLGDLYLASLLHDIGTIQLGESILHKPGPLTTEEMDIVHRHPVVGACIVSAIGPLAHLAPIVRSHHEHHDGTGYPDGLAGERIPLLARILSVADGWAAMHSQRPYRAALGPGGVAETLAAGAGSQWDSRIIHHALELCAEAGTAMCSEAAK